MKLRSTNLLFWLILAGQAGADDRLDRLPPEDRKWLEEEVVYIITDTERDVFLELDTVEQRQRLIRSFWSKRDPNPATPENEYRTEHYRRLEYANKFLARETFLPGWKTDRGRMYIILGEPREIQRYDGYNEIVPVQLWFYQGDPTKGIPSFFYLLFFKRNAVGEYQLYHPIVDGPQALLTGAQFTPGSDNLAALDALRQVNAELAQASLSFDTSDPADVFTGRASLGTDIMLARIEESPKRAIRTDYADAHLRYGEMVSANYSFNFVPSRSYFAVLYGPQDTPFVHYSIEIDPGNFSLETDEDQTKFYTTLDIKLDVKDMEGNLVLANDREVFIEFSQSQIDHVKANPLSYQDDFPLLPGEYQVSVIWQNRVNTQFTVVETNLIVEPRPAGKPFLSDVIAGYRSERRTDPGTGRFRTFQVDGSLIYPATGNIFPLGEPLHAFVQVLGASDDHRLRFTLLNGEEPLHERETRVGDYFGGPAIEQIPLTQMVGGNYQLRVQLLDPSETLIAEEFAPITVSPRTAIARPHFFYRRGFNPEVPGLLALARGEQLWALGRNEEARAAFQESVAAGNPELPMARWLLAGVFLTEGDGDAALELLAPLEEAFPGQYEVLAGLGFARFLRGELEQATGYLERAMTIRQPDTNLLNALGDSYRLLGDVEKARNAYQRSLELDSDQETVKRHLETFGKSR